MKEKTESIKIGSMRIEVNAVSNGKVKLTLSENDLVEHTRDRMTVHDNVKHYRITIYKDPTTKDFQYCFNLEDLLTHNTLLQSIPEPLLKKPFESSDYKNMVIGTLLSANEHLKVIIARVNEQAGLTNAELARSCYNPKEVAELAMRSNAMYEYSLRIEEAQKRLSLVLNRLSKTHGKAETDEDQASLEDQLVDKLRRGLNSLLRRQVQAT